MRLIERFHDAPETEAQVRQAQPFSPRSLSFSDEDIAFEYEQFERSEVRERLSRAAALVVALATALSVCMRAATHLEPGGLTLSLETVERLVWWLVVPTAAAGWALTKAAWFSRVYRNLLALGASLLSAGWLAIVYHAQASALTTLGPTLTVLMLFGVVVLVRAYVRGASLIGASLVLGYALVLHLRGEPASNVVIILCLLAAALAGATITGLLLERARRQAFFAGHLTEERRRDVERLTQELAAISRSDPLTGIANRRAFDEHMSRGLLRCARERAAISVLLIDIDHFRPFSDLYGHAAADACIVRVAQLLASQAARPDDLVARWRGKEFAVLLPNTDREGALKVASDIQKVVREARIAHDESPIAKHLTLSIGVGSCVASPHHGGAELLRAAAEALHDAKEAGRDRIVCAEPLREPVTVAVG